MLVCTDSLSTELLVYRLYVQIFCNVNKFEQIVMFVIVSVNKYLCFLSICIPLCH